MQQRRVYKLCSKGRSVKGMGQKLNTNDAALKAVQVLLRREDCAKGMEHTNGG